MKTADFICNVVMLSDVTPGSREAPKALSELIERYNSNRDAYLSGQYKEAQLRKEFIDPLLELLGWDVQNKAGYAEAYKEVIHEDAIRIGGTTKAPDYCLRVGGTRKFFVEAKKPSVNIHDDVESAQQLRRYGWNQKLSLCILTNFEQLSIYDTRIRPNREDGPAVARIRFIGYTEYVSSWGLIYNYFSKEAVLKGDFDRYAETERDKRGTLEVDDAFLKEIEGWREELAKNIALNNQDLGQEELNFAVQAIIDRIIFLRICEDRGIETYGRLKSLLEGANKYVRLLEFFRLADLRYNSGLFHFNEERGRPSSPDLLTPNLKVDDVPLRRIISRLYYPESPYEFSVLPADILGQVYEQFLGKVIRLTESHRAKVEEKPEVKKAGGVYYTPAHVVSYIVKNTIGASLRKRTPSTMQDFRVIDPACGSGSFLIAAYHFLLDWYRDQYVLEGPNKHKKRIVPGPGGLWLLTLEERKRILLQHIHGVDIDPQAVEVTKLSLLLKVLEGTPAEAINKSQRLHHDRVLPDLDQNIRCGNSLVNSDFVQAESIERIVRPFDWEREFPTVFQEGGFSAAIGNPPYVRIQTTPSEEIEYYNQKYESATGNYDVYCLFMERAFSLLRENGRMGFIVPHRWFKNDYGEGIRGVLSAGAVRHVLDFDGYMIFKEASINTCIIILSKERNDRLWYVQAPFKKDLPEVVAHWLSQVREGSLAGQPGIAGWVSRERLSKDPWVFILDDEKTIWSKLSTVSTSLGSVTSAIFQGFKTGADSVYIGEVIEEKVDTYVMDFKSGRVEIEKGITLALIKGGEMDRFFIHPTKRRIIYPYSSGKLLSEGVLSEQFPLAWAYLKGRRIDLALREDGKFDGAEWYGYSRSQALSVMSSRKIITPDYYAFSSFSYDEAGDFAFCGGGAGGYGIVPKGVDPYYLMALLNSRLVDWYIRKISIRAYQTAYMYVRKYIEPIPLIVPKSKDEVALSARLSANAKKLVSLHAQEASARTPDVKERTRKLVVALEGENDILVYRLYNISDAEGKIIERAAGKAEAILAR